MSAPRFSAVLPTLDEAERLGRTLDAARRALGDAAELIVVDAGSSDATVAIAEAAGARVLRGAPNRGAQLRAGGVSATGGVVVFLHADTILPPDAADAIDRALADPGVVGGAFRLRMDGPAPLRLRVLARGIDVRSRLFATATGDQAIFARRAALTAIGGVPAVPLFEDVRLYRALRKRGRVVLLDSWVATSPRRWLAHGVTRVATQHLVFRLLHAAGVAPERLARWYGRGQEP